MAWKIFGILCLFIVAVIVLIGMAFFVTAIFIITEDHLDFTDDSDVIHAPRGNQHGLGSTRTTNTKNTNK